MPNKDYTPEEIEDKIRVHSSGDDDVDHEIPNMLRQLAERDAEIERLKSKQEAMQMTITTQMRHLSNARILSSVIAYMVDRLRNDEEVPEDIVQGSWDKIVEMGYQRP